MANLRANKITGTEVFETTGSVQFDGSGDSLSVGTSSDLTLGTGDFTIEAYIYPSNITDAYRAIISNSYTGTIGGWSIYQYGNDLEMYYDAGGGSTPNIFDAVDVLTAGTWQHISVTRASSAMRVFVNGVQVASVSNSTDFAGTTVLIGDNNAGDYFFNGFISNLRVIKGTALYTKNFTPPTRELTVIPNTVLLACQSTTRANEEKTGKTITVNGNAVANELTPGLLTDRVKSGGSSAITGSVEFDGNDYLLESTGADGFNGGLGDWTIEAWMYCTDASQSDVLVNGLTSSTDRFYINFIGQTLYVGDFNINNIAIGGVKQVNSWFHIAVTKSGSTYRAFINGVLIGSSTESLLNSTLTSLQIGYRGSQNYYTKGFISNLRIVKGTALYTQNFIPPTRELKKLPGTVLLCCKNTSDPTAEETGKTITGYGSLDRTDLGVELVTNGTFDTDTTGWTAGNNATLAIDTARLKITSDSGGNGYAYQGIATKIGSQYRVSFDYTTGTGALALIWIGTSAGLGDVLQRGDFSTSGNYTVPFTATSTTSYIRIGANVPTGGLTYFFDNVSVTKLDPGTKPPFTPSIGSDGSVTFDGVTKINTPNYFYLPTGNTEDRGRGRGLFGGGVEGANAANTIQYINIQSSGNAIDFGDLTQARHGISACSSATRGVFGGGIGPTVSNVIDYVSIQTQGNAQDFGDLLIALRQKAALSNNSRGIFSGGYVPAGSIVSNSIEFITIASIGNAIDFGDLITITTNMAGCSSPTRGLFGGGSTPTTTNTIQYITIASLGNAQDFGDLTLTRGFLSACSSPTRGIFGGGSGTNIIEYVTISSTGNASDFGDLSAVKSELCACSNSVRGVFGGGYNPARLNVLEFITITSTGNAQDFGDLLVGNSQLAGCSDSHGGLG